MRARRSGLPWLLALLWSYGALPATNPAHAETLPAPAQVWLTARDTGQRLAAAGAAPFAAVPQPGEKTATVVVDPARRFQTMEGIGGALTDASAETFFKLPPAAQDEVIRAYFDADEGLGYTLARTHINSCDFSSAPYAYVEEAGDTALKTFSVAHDRKYRIPFIRRALAAAPALKIFASPWSPPAWMKTNGTMLHGGALKPECRDAWARYYVRFVEAYAAHGVPLWGLTVQNEPLATQIWESCIYTAEEERDFVRDFLGPALRRAGLGRLKLMIWDHNRGLVLQRAGTVLSDPEAAKFVWGTAFHWYMGEQYANLGLLHEAFPDSAILFSEGCQGPFSTRGLDDWSYGEGYGRSMIHDFNNWTCGWCDWNVLLDERGGPNHVGNFCFAPLHADTRTGELRRMSSYWYLGHFSRFVRPGARRLACTASVDTLLATAFQNEDGRIVCVVQNQTDQPQELQIWAAGAAAPTKLPAHSIATVVWRAR